jgi:branched-chain amino acid aminotransferase
MLPRSFSRATTTARSTTLALTASSRRQYSINPPPPAQTLQAPDAADPSTLTITKTTTPKTTLPHNELVFGRNFTDHMLLLEWTAADGWLDPRITPYQNLSLDPATCVLHYAFEAFEGMKAYKDRQGNVRLFRPDKNMARLNKSAARIALPRFDGEAFIELLKKFVKLDERFIPS